MADDTPTNFTRRAARKIAAAVTRAASRSADLGGTPARTTGPLGEKLFARLSARGTPDVARYAWEGGRAPG